MLRFKVTPVYNRFYSSSSNYLNRQINHILAKRSTNLSTLLQSHAYIISTGHANNPFLASKLISLYASLNLPRTCAKIFNSTAYKDPFLWNAIIKAHFDNGDYLSSLECYDSMRSSGSLPDQFSIPMVVSACAELGVVVNGEKIHGLVKKLNLFNVNSAVGSSFVYMYSKCGNIGGAWGVFDEIPNRDVVTWTALVIGFVQNGEMEKGLERLCEMHRIGGNSERPNFRTLEGGFQACGNLCALVEGRCLHGLAVKNGIMSNGAVQSAILSMYSKCGAVDEACLSFDEVVQKDLLSWTSIIGVYGKMAHIDQCLSLFIGMQIAGFYPDGVVLNCVLACFGNSMRISEGRAFHAYVLRRQYEVDDMVRNGLLSMYCNFGMLNLAEKLFDGGREQPAETWNMMLISYCRTRSYPKCLELFREMQYLGIESDSSSLISVICSCSRLEATNMGRSLHCHIIKMWIRDNISITNSLIDMYGRIGNLTVARRIFCMVEKDTVTWNALISSYVRNGTHFEALALFDRMLLEGETPNTATLVTLLSACSHTANLEKGQQIHEFINKGGLAINVSLATALTDMYAKCGELLKSREIFDSMMEKDVISWNVMISGYGMHGDVKSAIDIFRQMEKASIRPNGLTFLALLSACAHAGYVEEGKSLFHKMKDYSLTPTLKHYACMVDLFGRSGHLHDAEALILSMPVAPDAEVWGALVSACKTHNDMEMGIRIAKHAIESDPENDGYYVIISDLYSSLGMWEEVELVRKIMKEREVRKRVGWSTV